MIIGIINFSIFVIADVTMVSLYFISLQPAKREKKYGQKVWKQSKILREIAQWFQILSLINLILWIWFPLPIVNQWLISSNIWIGLIIGICMIIPGIIIMYKGVKDAGDETYAPSKDTKLHGGIYNYVRHPQSAGEIPVYIAVGFLLNSWFIVIVIFVFLVIYISLMIYIEEKDLVRRFGEEYIEYQKNVGCFTPKIRR
ncbi:MAG: isoprenylcysteine carboxylmethyltransferase family protein [Candidatus Lokiarchaeota archaeon]